MDKTEDLLVVTLIYLQAYMFHLKDIQPCKLLKNAGTDIKSMDQEETYQQLKIY